MRYYLHRKNNDGSHAIFMEIGLGTIKHKLRDGSFKYEAVRFRAYTGEKIHEHFWDSKKKRAKPAFSGADDLNEFLNNLSNQVIQLKRETRLKGEQLTLQNLKEKLLPKKEAAAHSLTMIECLTKYIDDHKLSLASGTLKNFTTLKGDLEELSKKKHVLISFESIADDFLLKFQAFLYAKGNTDNTFAKKVEKLKTFLRWATERGYSKNRAFEKFKAPRKKKKIIWLNQSELKKIEDCKDLSKELEKTRDIFLFGCYTGLRYSDIENLKQENILTDEHGKRFIKIIMQKVKKEVTIPLIAQAENYLKGYNKDSGLVFECLSNQAMNDNLKDLGRVAKINTVIERVRFQGAKRIELSQPKAEFLSTHCARHSFAINSLQRGMKVEVLQKILGHADISETMGYVEIAEQYASEHFDKVWEKKNDE